MLIPRIYKKIAQILYSIFYKFKGFRIKAPYKITKTAQNHKNRRNPPFLKHYPTPKPLKTAEIRHFLGIEEQGALAEILAKTHPKTQKLPKYTISVKTNRYIRKGNNMI